MHSRFILFGVLFYLALSVIGVKSADEPLAPPPSYIPEPEIKELIERALQSDKQIARKAREKLAAVGVPAERALLWHLAKETTPGGRLKWAELLAWCGRGQVGYRVTLELRPDGAGNLTLWSDRAFFSACSKRFARMSEQIEPIYSEETLRYNPYSRVELLKHFNDGIKYLEGRVEQREGRIEAIGMLSFKDFNALSAFAESFDSNGYNLLGGSSLTDAQNGIRTFRYRKAREDDRERFQDYLLKFYNMRWELIVDFKGRVSQNNATRTDGSKLIWAFNCHQMLTGAAQVELSFENTGLTPRPITSDIITIPTVTQADQPIAIPKLKEIHAKVYTKTNGAKPTAKELRERGQLVELDGRDSLPRNAPRQFQWAQTYGGDLGLSAEVLSKDYVCLIIKEPGEYCFELTVSANGLHSKPTEVRVYVTADEVVNAQSPIIPPSIASPPLAPPEHKPEIKPPSDRLKPVTPTVTSPPLAPPEYKPEIKPPSDQLKPVTSTVTPPPIAPPEYKPEIKPPSEQSDARASRSQESLPTIALDPIKADELHAEGVRLIKINDLAKAKTVLMQACALHPKDMACLFDLGIVLMELGDIQLAIAKFEEVASAGKNAKALMNLGHCYARMNNIDEARQWYRQGVQIGQDAVIWEPVWQLGNSQLKSKDYQAALTYFAEAEKKAANAKVQDYRLLRDMAIALHACKKDTEALKRLQAMQALGYVADSLLLAEIKQGAEIEKKSEASPLESAGKPARSKESADESARSKESVDESARSKEAVKIVEKIAPPVALPETPASKPLSPKVDLSKTSESVKSNQSKQEPKKRKEPKSVIPKKPLPPIPDDFNEALAAGKRALQAGAQAQAKNTEETKIAAAQFFDEAEAMLRGAWSKKPGDEKIISVFQELAKHIGAIALVKNSIVKAKANGLVVLDAEASIAPNDKPLYCIWEQVDGEELGLRPENMTQKKVGLRIKKPGIYKFELAVSDGVRGGNPVTVTVEIDE